MKLAEYMNKRVQFAEGQKREREKNQATKTKFRINHLFHTYSPPVREMSKYNAV
jgi:hypothetical protein